MRSVCSNVCHNVRIARLRYDVYAMSNLKPPSFSNLPAAAASVWPFSDNGQSYHPVNLFSWFHVDSPCRISTSWNASFPAAIIDSRRKPDEVARRPP